MIVNRLRPLVLLFTYRTNEAQDLFKIQRNDDDDSELRVAPPRSRSLGPPRRPPPARPRQTRQEDVQRNGLSRAFLFIPWSCFTAVVSVPRLPFSFLSSPSFLSFFMPIRVVGVGTCSSFSYPYSSLLLPAHPFKVTDLITMSVLIFRWLTCASFLSTFSHSSLAMFLLPV